MKRLLTVLAVTLAVAAADPAAALENADPALVAAAERVFSTMPADFYLVEPAAALQQIKNEKPLVLDVREEKELPAGKVPGSILMPLRDLPRSLAKLPENKAAPILVYCKSGYREAMAVMVLRMWGYTNVLAIKGGFDGWEKANLPVEGKRAG